MKNKTLRTLIIITAIFSQIYASGQLASNEYPVMGERMPEVRLTDVHYYEKKIFDPNEVKGKWVILDFWETGCSACVKSFPKVSQLQVEFKEHIQFMLVGKLDSKHNKNIRKIFDKYKESFHLELPVAYDSAIFKRFGIQGVPRVIVIDPEKMVYAVTDNYFLNRESLTALIENRKPLFNKKDVFVIQPGTPWRYLVKEKEMDDQKDFKFRSILSPNADELMQGSWKIDEYASKGFYQIVGASLSDLYDVAYFGQMHWPMSETFIYNTCLQHPVLEINDTSHFRVNNIDRSGLYNYSVTIPIEETTKEYLMETMQNDLKKYFGYDVRIETRIMPYWRLTATEDAKRRLISKSSKVEYNLGPTLVDVKKFPISLVLGQVVAYNAETERCPFIDETNIHNNIDISFSAVMTDMNNVRKALLKHGLILEKSEKAFKVLVIRDPK